MVSEALARSDRDHWKCGKSFHNIVQQNQSTSNYIGGVRYEDLECANILSNPLPVILSNALGNPGKAPDLLLLQLDVAVKYSIRELLHERELVQVNLLGEEPVLEMGG